MLRASEMSQNTLKVFGNDEKQLKFPSFSVETFVQDNLHFSGYNLTLSMIQRAFQNYIKYRMFERRKRTHSLKQTPEIL